MTYTVRALDRSGMSCEVTSTARSGRYRIVTDYVTDPRRNTVVMRLSLTPLAPGPLSLYVRFDPTVNGNGGGGAGNGGPDSALTDTSSVTRLRSRTTRTRRPTRSTATTLSRSSRLSTGRSRR